ncbi:MAG: U32 family peptidase [Candidatus Bathyarchaeia archaeon]|nr:U32 family peptidase [Candidatus Bathyarchaeota archaeon]
MVLKILAPVDKVEEVTQIIEAGADELYCGLLSREFLKKYTIAAINRRPSPACNFKSFEELKEAVRIAHSYGVPVALTINEHYYTEDMYPLLRDFVEKCVDADVDSFIISDLGLLLWLRDLNVGVKLSISTGGVALNSESIKFYQELGASRIQLPRHLTLKEIRDIHKEISCVETGVFILNSKCANIDGFCTFLHFTFSDPAYNNACMLPYEIYVESSEDDEKRVIAGVRQQVWQRFHIDDRPCGACALYEFNEIGLTYVKIVGRGYPTSKKIIDVKFIRSLLNTLSKNPSRREFRDIARNLYTSTYGRQCRVIMCYYPEVILNGTSSLYNKNQ